MRTVAIVGTGLIGGSFGLALRASGFTGEILGVSSPPAVEEALRMGAIDRAAALPEAARSADLIFLAQPVRRIVETIAALDPVVRPDALITDAGSTKLAIVTAAQQHITRCSFLGGHPMAGSEKSGASAADAGLFRNRPWVLTPRAEDDLQTPAVAELRSWLERFGAEVMVMDPRQHDRIVAFTSHVPQLASTALAASLEDEGPSGPGLLDMTRLALSSFEVWKDILFTNREFVNEALRRYISTLEAVDDALDSANDAALRELFLHAQQVAARIRAGERPIPDS